MTLRHLMLLPNQARLAYPAAVKHQTKPDLLIQGRLYIMIISSDRPCLLVITWTCWVSCETRQTIPLTIPRHSSPQVCCRGAFLGSWHVPWHARTLKKPVNIVPYEGLICLCCTPRQIELYPCYQVPLFLHMTHGPSSCEKTFIQSFPPMFYVGGIFDGKFQLDSPRLDRCEGP